MHSLVHSALTPRKQLPKVQVVNIFTPNVMIVTLQSRRVAPKELYFQLEQLMARVWKHSPGWRFGDPPAVGTFVIAMQKNRSNFKRGVILSITQIHGDLLYYVFLYDWGIIRRFIIDDLARLPGEQKSKLEPRSFIVVLAGMVEITSVNERDPDGDYTRGESTNCGGEDAKGNRKSRRLRRAHNRHVACSAARDWFESGLIYMDPLKKFDGVITLADLKRLQTGGNTNEFTTTSKNDKYSAFMEKQGHCYMDKKRLREDLDGKVNNWESVLKRVEKIKFDEVSKYKGAEQDNVDRREQFGDTYLLVNRK